MAWTAPRTWVAGETVTAALLNTHVRDDLNALTVGEVTTVTSGVGPTSGTTQLILATSAEITGNGIDAFEVAFSWYNITKTVSTDVFLVALYDGDTAGSGTQLTQWLLIILANGGSGYLRTLVTPSTGAHTYTARLYRSAGTGTASLAAAATTPAQLSVRAAIGANT